METSSSSDQARLNALDQADRAERAFRVAFLGAVAFEGIFLVALLMACDLSSHLDRLVLISTVGGYTLLVLGLVALGAYLNRAVLRVLKALKLGGMPGSR